MKLVQMLRNLQEIDREWDEKGRIYQSTKQQLGDESRLEAMRSTRLQAGEDLRTVSATLRDHELQLQTLQSKMREIEGSLYGGRVRAFKELEDLRQESELLKSHIASLEDEMLEIMAQIDDLVEADQSTESQLQAFESQWRVEREALLDTYQTLRARLQELQGERKQIRDSIAETPLAIYDELRKKKGGTALARMEDGRCQACHVAVPVSKVQAVSSGDVVILCEGCDRILYQD